MIEEDIARIREAYPGLPGQGAADLPRTFGAHHGDGHVDPLTAYDIFTMQKKPRAQGPAARSRRD